MAAVAEREELAAIEKWFASRGFGLAFRERDGEMWADLRGLHNPHVVLEAFGGGHGAMTELDAARAAKHRYTYQEEPPPQPPRRLP